MKRKVIRHSIVLVVFACMIQVMGKIYVGFSNQYPGKSEPAKSTMVWALFSDATSSPAESTPDTESGLSALLLLENEYLLVADYHIFFSSFSGLVRGHIPLDVTDSSPPTC
ncbi:hypothetical protein [Prolixibacter bellariivorans]|uniref:hypothetical protein n=1 Tax=Prolixibacter bellariivorans TaxID=314319 RepID=UPI00046E9736|nr:hypothetical protein [Prolixibacter bellariivorans]